jgi:hypothetical protein
MKAVNLVPIDTRGRQTRLSASPRMLAAIGGLALILVAAALYVSAANTVSTNKRELARVTAGAVSWTAAANTYASFVGAVRDHAQELADVRQLATSRFPWSGLLSQISGLMPRAAALSSLQASTASTTDTSPAAQLIGCAASQSAVAQTMVQLQRIDGVSAVTLASSSDAAGGSTSGAADQGSAGGCPFPVQFQLSLTFAASSAADAADAASASGASSAPAPAASGTGTSVTGAAQ